MMTNDEQEHARYAYVRTESYNLMVILSEAILRLEKKKHADQWLLSDLSRAHGKAVEFNMFMVTLSDWTPAEAALAAVPVAEIRRIIEMHDARHWSSVESPPLYAAVRAWLEVQP